MLPFNLTFKSQQPTVSSIVDEGSYRWFGSWGGSQEAVSGETVGQGSLLCLQHSIRLHHGYQRNDREHLAKMKNCEQWF